jgi:3-hydroxyisobutyrate dehydrogenase-like beta-hydroxyacid dehydrogenase
MTRLAFLGPAAIRLAHPGQSPAACSYRLESEASGADKLVVAIHAKIAATLCEAAEASDFVIAMVSEDIGRHGGAEPQGAVT